MIHKLEISKGISVLRAVEEALSYMHTFPEKDTVEIEFNGIELQISNKSHVNDILYIYDLKSAIRRLKAGYKD